MDSAKSEGGLESEKVSASELNLVVPKWPKIELSQQFKQDILKAFMLFDIEGQGTVSLDAVRVAFRALGYDSLMNEFKALRKKTKDNHNQVDFGEFLNLIQDRMLAIDDDMEIEKCFELMDTGAKGYIDLADLKRTAEILEIDEITDDDLSVMLLGAQITDPAKELQAQYEQRQEQARLRSGHTYKVDPTPLNPYKMGGPSNMVGSGLPGFPRTRRLSSSGQQSPDTLTVNFEQFRNLMKMTRPPVEDIKLL